MFTLLGVYQRPLYYNIIEKEKRIKRLKDYCMDTSLYRHVILYDTTSDLYK